MLRGVYKRVKRNKILPRRIDRVVYERVKRNKILPRRIDRVNEVIRHSVFTRQELESIIDLCWKQIAMIHLRELLK